jgi:hypothetical protein
VDRPAAGVWQSLEKWKALKQLCKAKGVATSPELVKGRVWCDQNTN